MPTRADIEAATPKCPRSVGPGTHTSGEWVARCGAQLRRLTGREPYGEGWRCPEHGAVKFREVAPLPPVASSAER